MGCWHRAGSAPAIAAIGSAAVAGAVACWALMTLEAKLLQFFFRTLKRGKGLVVFQITSSLFALSYG